jgi:phage gpG-like protein
LTTKVKINLSNVRKKLGKLKEAALPTIERTLEIEILKNIKSGVSPVKGQGFFVPYSKSYTDAIIAGRYRKFGKRRRPINLTLSGDLLDSFFIKAGEKKITLGFTNELAEIHNTLGASKKKVIRRLLPTESGEKFNDSIEFRVREAVRKALRLK